MFHLLYRHKTGLLRNKQGVRAKKRASSIPKAQTLYQKRQFGPGIFPSHVAYRALVQEVRLISRGGVRAKRRIWEILNVQNITDFDNKQGTNEIT